MDAKPAMKIYVKGKLVSREEAVISPFDRGFTLGDGVFETMRVAHGRIFRRSEHLVRLRQSARAIHMDLPMQDDFLAEALSSVIRENELADAVLRLTVTRGVPDARGLLPTAAADPTVVIQPSPFVPPPEEKYRQGFRAITASVRRNEHAPTAFIKSCNYLDNVVARIEAAEASADEAIMLNTAALVACGTSSNIFLIRAGALITPSISTGVLAGITRAAVIRLATGMGVPVSEKLVAPAEIDSADECFLTNSVVGVMPLVKLDDRPIGDGKPGQLTQALREAYNKAVESGPTD